MNNKTFKVGDLVYYPYFSNKVFTLEAYVNLDNLLKITNKDGRVAAFYEDGKLSDYHEVKSIFHANEENRILLEKLYGVEFENPKSRPTPKQVIEHLLKTHKYVACYTSDVNETPSLGNVKNFIIHVYDRESLPFKDAENATWQFAMPFDLKTGEVITETDDEQTKTD